jgi:hypothetical protein
VACDKTLVNLALLRQLVAGDPNRPGWYSGPLALARDVEAEGWPLHLPARGHQDTEQMPDMLPKWLARERESDLHLTDRIEGYLNELHGKGILDRLQPAPFLSHDGGQVVLRLLHAESEEPA